MFLQDKIFRHMFLLQYFGQTRSRPRQTAGIAEELESPQSRIAAEPPKAELLGRLAQALTVFDEK